MGETKEYEVYKKIEHVTLTSNNILTLHSFLMPLVKCTVLGNEFTNIQTDIQTFAYQYLKAACSCRGECYCLVGETDFVLLVRGKGVVLIEVKTSAKQKAKAVKQLQKNGEVVEYHL